jgi:hypothetical protein
MKPKRRTNKRAKQKARPLPPPTQKKLFGQTAGAISWFFRGLLGLITLAGGWALVRPVVRVEPYIQLDPSNPFSERFKLSNEGNFSIRDVSYFCYVKSAKGPGFDIDDMRIVKNFGYQKTMIAGISTTIDCPLSNIVEVDGGRYSSATIAFSVTFKPDWYVWHKTRVEWFEGTLDSEGRVQWLHP